MWIDESGRVIAIKSLASHGKIGIGHLFGSCLVTSLMTAHTQVRKKTDHANGVDPYIVAQEKQDAAKCNKGAVTKVHCRLKQLTSSSLASKATTADHSHWTGSWTRWESP